MKDNRVSLASYEIRTCHWGPGGEHMKQWKIEGSNDGSNWTLLDARDTDALNGSWAMKKFECSQGTNEFFRYIRLTQTGLNWFNNHRIVLGGIEFFGRLLGE